MTDNYKKPEVKKPEVSSASPMVPDEIEITGKPVKEKFSPEQKKRIKEIKTYLKKSGKSSTYDSRLGTITLKTEVTQ